MADYNVVWSGPDLRKTAGDDDDGDADRKCRCRPHIPAASPVVSPSLTDVQSSSLPVASDMPSPTLPPPAVLPSPTATQSSQSSTDSKWTMSPSSSVLPSPTVVQCTSSSFQPSTDSKKTKIALLASSPPPPADVIDLDETRFR